ncbi:MAG TPA: hypothetical protein DCW47_08715 [Lachnospiraceae bacterium]|nr:hypothetical protein [Lachnospiraceae bacterium]
MPQYGLYEEESGKIRNLSKEEARTELNTRLNAARTTQEKQNRMEDFLTGLHSGVRFNETSQTRREKVFGDKYKNILSTEERRKQIQKSGTELYQKDKNAKALRAANKKRYDKMKLRAVSAADRTGVSLTDPALVMVARFMTGSAKNDALLLSHYKKGGNNRAEALLEMMRLFMKLDPDSIDVSSEKKIADNSDKLENLSEKLYAIHHLITLSPDIYKSFGEDFQDTFEERYAKAKTVVTYYRLKKEVMQNNYYRTHLNREICKDINDKDTPEQKLLSELIWQSEGGLALFSRNLNENVNSGIINELVGALRTVNVRNNKQRLSEKILQRQEEIQKTGLSTHLDNVMLKEGQINSRGEVNPAGRAVRIKKLKLSGDASADLNDITKIMDQLDILNSASDFKKNNRDSYLLEQSDLQIKVCDTALAAKDILMRMRDSLLFLGRLRADGSIDASPRSQSMIDEYKRRYRNDLKAYADIMDILQAVKQMPFDPDSEKNMLSEKYEKTDITPELRASANQLLLELTENGFSDRDIYLRMKEIFRYSTIFAEEKLGSVFWDLENRAAALWREKRYLNLLEAKRLNLPGKNIDDELTMMKSYHDSRFGNTENGNGTEEGDWTYEPILALRNKAMEKKLDMKDMKDRAGYYMSQYEWLSSAYPDSYSGNLGLIPNILLTLAKYLYKWNRTADYGKNFYEGVKQNINKFPSLLREINAQTLPLKFQRGDADLVPPVEITRYFADKDKIAIAEYNNRLKDYLQDPGQIAPELMAHLRKLSEAVGIYSQTQCAVTDESIELELAAIDTFRNEAENYFMKKGRLDLNDPVTGIIVDIMKRLDSFTGGNLRSRMTDAEYAAALEQKPVFTQRSESDLKESNVKDLPLFTHRPNINDAKQGMCGDCHFLATLQALVSTDPDAILNMFHDVGDGTVLVRLYAAYDKSNRRVDDYTRISTEDVTVRPTYVRVRKDYERDGSFPLDSIWVQLLEKAVAAAGFNHGVAKVEESGRLRDFQYEISCGSAEKDLFHLTGVKVVYSTNTALSAEYQLPPKELEQERARILFNGIPMYLHEDLWDKLGTDSGAGSEEDDSETIFLDKLGKLLRDNREQTVKNTGILVDLITRKKLMSEEDTEELKAEILKIYDFNPEKLVEKVRDNIRTGSTKKDGDSDYEAPAKLFAQIINALEEKCSKQDILKLVHTKKKYYESLKREGENEANYKNRMSKTDHVTLSCNKAMLETNPDNRYSIDQMAALSDIKRSIRAGKAVAVYQHGHLLSAHDVKLYNGHWFILVKDPHNIKSIEYNKNRKGGVSKDTFLMGKAQKVMQYNRVRSLDNTIRTTVLGTSWWELNDFTKEIYAYTTLTTVPKSL